MSYQVFARKYRPLTFDDVLGQDHVVQTLKNAIEHNRLAHAYLFVGPRGTGKTSTARIFAKALNCSGGPKVDFDPHEDICEEIAEGRSLDVLEIDGASNRGIDHIRDLRDNVRFAPSRGNFRIVYIDEVHMLTKESFNALLKTLEEPPPHVKFIFATTEPHKILPTILSRCQRFDLRPIPSEIIAGHLLHIASTEGVNLSREAAFAVAKVADGGMRDAQSMLDQLVSFCGDHIEEQQVLHIFGITSRETVAHALALILNKELPSLLHLLHEQAEAGRDMSQFLSEIISAVREILVSKVDPEASFDSLPESSKEELAGLVKRTHTDKILRLVEVLAETENKMRWSTNKRLHLEMGLIKAVHTLAEASISDIIMALEGAPLAAEAPTSSSDSVSRQKTSASTPSATALRSDDQPPVAATKPFLAPEEHLMDPVPDFSAASTYLSPAAQKNQGIDTQASPYPVQEAEPQQKTIPPAAETSPLAVAEEEISYSATKLQTKTVPAPRETTRHSGSTVSDVPEFSTDSPEPTFMDPEENLPPERRTKSFFDNLFDTPVPSSRPQTPIEKEEPAVPSQQSGKTITEENWKTVLEQVAVKFPLQADFLTNSVFSGYDGVVAAISFHPSDRQGIDSLASGPLRTALEAALSQHVGAPVTISIRQDFSVPEPVQEELAPLPAPPPPASPVPAPKPHTQREKTAEPVQETTKEENEDNSYYTDPLIDAAMEIFRARIISQ